MIAVVSEEGARAAQDVVVEVVVAEGVSTGVEEADKEDIR